jgi:hypothetical protein
MRLKVIKTIAFLLIGALLFVGFWNVFRFKQEKRLEKLWTLPGDTVDVMFIGSSHAFMNIDPSVLWRESGISAYVLGCGSQPIWESYYHLKEALKRQMPKVVFVECYKVDGQKNYSAKSVTALATSGMRLGRNYLEMLDASVKNREYLFDYLLRFPWFHSRYREITAEDYMPDYGNVYYRDYLGYFRLTQSIPGQFPRDLNAVTETARLSNKNRMYLNKLVELSKERGFDLVFLITPFWKNATAKQPYYNSLAEFAEKKGVPLINCNLVYDELGMDDARDFSKTSHLSVTGAEKMTMYLNDYLNAHWKLADHRGDKRYGVWDRNLALMEEIRSDPEAWGNEDKPRAGC